MHSPTSEDLATILDVFDSPATDDPSTPLLSLRDLSVRFGGVAALTDVKLDVYRSDLVAVIGPNGAGKSTMLNAISGVVPATGSIVYRNHELARMRAARISAKGIGRSFQDPPLLDRETVLENVLGGAHLRLGYNMVDQVFRRGHVRRSENAVRRRALALLDFVGLSADVNVPAGELSFGARKLVDISRAMLSGPQLLLLDEPSSGLDLHERLALQEILLTLRRHECVAILAVEHHMDLVRATATHVFALQAGRAFMHGTPTEVLDSPLFRESIVGGSHGEQLATAPGAEVES